MTTTTDPVAVELTELSAVSGLFDLPGPFASAVFHVPMPGGDPGERATRWHSVRHRLAMSGAPQELLDAAGRLIERLPPAGRPVYLTATGGTVAYRWLDPTVDGERAVFDSLPDLVPAVGGLQRRRLGIGVAVDHLGADVLVVSDDAAPVSESVDGSDEHVHLAASGGWSQRRHQSHTRLIWERNATLVARDLVALARQESPTAIVVTGDDRSRGFLLDHLPAALREVAHVVSAGGRSDPDVIDRLVAATAATVDEVEAGRRDALVSRLAEELGQHDRAVAGADATVAALAAGSVETLFTSWDDDCGIRAWFGPGTHQVAMAASELESAGIGASEGRLVDVALRAALGTDVEVVLVDVAELPAGEPVAALLRHR